MAERKEAHESITEEFEMIPKGEKKASIRAYREAHKFEIIADYHEMDGAEFLKKWKLPVGSWSGLKRQWKVPNNFKRKGREDNPDGQAEKPLEAEKEPVDVSLSEHDRYLILLGYQQAIRELIRARVFEIGPK